MENSFFLRIEILLFFSSIWYILYYIYTHIYDWYSSIKKIVKTPSERTKEIEQRVANNSAEPASILTTKGEEKNVYDSDEVYPLEETIWEYLSPENSKNKEIQASPVRTEDKVKITAILKKEAIHYSRWEYDLAKNLIIEWLAIDKHNKELNLELANIYNKQKEYKKSEYIYRDLIEHLEDDYEILKRLGFVLALQTKYKDAIRVYKDAYDKRKDDLEVIDILSELNYEIGDYETALIFLSDYLKQKPRDFEKIVLKAYSYDNLWNYEKALEYYKKFIDLQPYNKEVADRIREIEYNLKK